MHKHTFQYTYIHAVCGYNCHWSFYFGPVPSPVIGCWSSLSPLILHRTEKSIKCKLNKKDTIMKELIMKQYYRLSVMYDNIL